MKRRGLMAVLVAMTAATCWGTSFSFSPGENNNWDGCNWKYVGSPPECYPSQATDVARFGDTDTTFTCTLATHTIQRIEVQTSTNFTGTGSGPETVTVQTFYLYTPTSNEILITMADGRIQTN
ncbi:hypothetical protein RAS1_12420 [Phycisphaerae bacterium RAS1]|nr:hypothetical protein RAS1_12420 [Phycisphaerae bacterium RAS1]